MKSKPNYYRVTDMEYEKRNYEFFQSSEVETYWLDTWYFCTNTPLGKFKKYLHLILFKFSIYVCLFFILYIIIIGYRLGSELVKLNGLETKRKTAITIDEACVYRGALEAVAEDDGTVPGDNKGAAGFDSHLFA